MKRRWRTWFTGWLLLLALLSSSACNPITTRESQAKTETVVGEDGKMGEGTVRTYAELNVDGSPVSLGMIYTQKMLEGLPAEPNLKSRCFDINTNGMMEMSECIR
jgi:hypothetical protein